MQWIPDMFGLHGMVSVEPENTKASVESLYQKGYRGVVLSIMHDKEGRVWCCHDTKSNRRLLGDNQFPHTPFKDMTTRQMASTKTQSFINGHHYPMQYHFSTLEDMLSWIGHGLHVLFDLRGNWESSDIGHLKNIFETNRTQYPLSIDKFFFMAQTSKVEKKLNHGFSDTYQMVYRVKADYTFANLTRNKWNFKKGNYSGIYVHKDDVRYWSNTCTYKFVYHYDIGEEPLSEECSKGCIAYVCRR